MSDLRPAVRALQGLTAVGRRVAAAAAAFVTSASLILVPACSPSDHDSASAAKLSSDVQSFLQRFDEYDKVRAVLVDQGGETVLALWRGQHAHDYVNVGSATGSVVSILIGIAIDQGRISGLDATLGELLPAYRGAMTREVAAITLRAILSNTAGFAPGGSTPYNDQLNLTASTDWVGTIIADRVARGPGDGSFAYSNAGAHLLAAILDEATEGSVLDDARKQLFDRIGIRSEPAWVHPVRSVEVRNTVLAEGYFAAGFAWPTDPRGTQVGAGLLKLRPEDLLALGRLYVDGGVWDGRRVVSREWVEASTRSHAETGRRPSGYGYGWWVDRTDHGPVFLALGYGGLMLAAVPERDLVVVVVSDYNGRDPADFAEQFHTDEAFNMIEYLILPQVG
ncbi:serine hydrolase [Microbacterium deminutum]